MITEERALQISNNVSEEFADLGKTNFATKKELCETIFWLNTTYGKELEKLIQDKRQLQMQAIFRRFGKPAEA